MISPCKDCKERRPHCHGSCEKYAEFLTELEKKHKQDEVHTALASLAYRRKWRRRQ